MPRFQCYVAYRKRCPGIYQNWNDCKAEVHKYLGAQYKGFKDVYDAEQSLQNYLATTGHGSDRSETLGRVEAPQHDLNIHYGDNLVG